MKDKKPEDTDYKDTGCKYWFDCNTCPFEKCRLDCKREEHFLAPVRYQCIRLCYKVFPSIFLIRRVFNVGKTTVYKALSEEEKE